MKEKLVVANDSRIEYSLKRSRRARRLRVVVHGDGRVVATAPYRAPEWLVDEFVNEHTSWLREKVDQARERREAGVTLSRPARRRDYLKHKEAARALVEERVAYFNAFYNFDYGKVRIQDQKTRWGSCSSK